jgi:hypothetical protein
MRRVLLVHLDGGGFPHGFKATRPRAPWGVGFRI